MLRPAPIIVVLAFLFGGCPNDLDSSSEPATAGVDTVIPLEIQPARIGGLNLDQPRDALITEARSLREGPYGPIEVRTETEMLEGMPEDVLIVSFGDHEIMRRWAGVEISDPAFRTRDNLGVGSTVADFAEVLDIRPDFTQERGQAAMFALPERHLRLGLQWGCDQPTCEVVYIWFTTGEQL